MAQPAASYQPHQPATPHPYGQHPAPFPPGYPLGSAPRMAAPYPPAPARPTHAPPRPAGAPLDLAAVFGLAGAGLFAVAALVFAFFLVDDSPLLRVGVLLLVTGLSATGTVLLLRRGLRASAQAVAWLTTALAVVDCWVIGLLAQGSGREVVIAAALSVTIAAGVLLARRTGMRAWSSVVVLAPLVPLLLGGATDQLVGITVGTAVAAAVTLVRRPFRGVFAPAVGARTPVESVLLVCWAGLLLFMLPWLIAGSVAQRDPIIAASGNLSIPLALGLALGLVVTAGLTAAQAWSEGARTWWGFVGFLLVAAGACVGEVDPTSCAVTVGACVVWLVLVLLRRPSRPWIRAAVFGGGVAVLLSALPVLGSVPVVLALLERVERSAVAELLPVDAFSGVPGGAVQALVAALCVLALSLVVQRRQWPPREVSVVVPQPMGTPQFHTALRPALELSFARVLAPVGALIAAVMLPALLAPWSPALLTAELLLAVALVEAVRRIGRHRLWWTVLLIGAVGEFVLLAALSWVSRPTVLIGAVLVPALVLRLWGRTAPALRWLLTAAAVAYPAAVAPVALSWLGWSGSTIAGLLALVLLALTVALTPLRRVDTGSWAAVLTVAAVPVLLVCGWSVTDRSWAAAWTGAALAVTECMVLITRTRPVPRELRVIIGALILPTVALALVNAGALLMPGSASPVLLPVIAVLSAGVAVAAASLSAGLDRRGMSRTRTVWEWSALCTGGIALLVALAWPTTGADTVLIICAVLAAGASVVAVRADRHAIWWLAGALWTGVLWTALTWGRVGLVEAYTVPPAVAAVLVGGWLTRRNTRWWSLVASGLALMIVPSLVLVLAGVRVELRATALLAGAGVATGLAFWLDRPRLRPRFGVLADAFAWAAGAAALAGPIRAVWLAATTAVGSEPRNAALFGAALAWAAIGAVLLAMVGALLADRRPRPRVEAWRRWSLAPALAVFTVAGLCAVRPTWTVVWVALAIELGVLGLTVLSVRSALAVSRHRNGGPSSALAILPPAWFCWLVAVAWAIGGWSLRELRVEAFALPLGLALTAAGVLALRGAKERPTPRSWPVGFTTSMTTLAPGVAATLGPSLLAIWTDPVTWRAILVVGLCLLFMVAGARELLRAPLLIGSIALGLAVLSVFGSRLGSAISAGPWLLTLMSAGGLLLVLGIYAERRKPGEGVPRKSLL
ncbi:hypothetical protein [Cellulomonas sp. NPDC089187]|uniref:SCO7613 C-terminal domain-containing membrane protein n=1 Tax=Cellulomonas sp. NPDC089187 TaxID=3154970 RepID=UPI003428E611